MLGVFMVPIVLMIGWMCTITLFYVGYPPAWGRVTVLAIPGRQQELAVSVEQNT
jgi:hypothetical protein